MRAASVGGASGLAFAVFCCLACLFAIAAFKSWAGLAIFGWFLPTMWVVGWHRYRCVNDERGGQSLRGW